MAQDLDEIRKALREAPCGISVISFGERIIDILGAVVNAIERRERPPFPAVRMWDGIPMTGRECQIYDMAFKAGQTDISHRVLTAKTAQLP